ncbi:hypothetical protein C4K43_07260, partial (plasmid) [Lawsonia intracellularis]
MSIYITKYVINTFLSKWRAIVALFLCICIILNSVTVTISADKDSEKNINSSKENIAAPLGESGNTEDFQQAETSSNTQQPQVPTSPSGMPVTSGSQVVLDLFSPPPPPPPSSTIFSPSFLCAPLTLYGPPAMSYIPIPNMGVRRSYSSPDINCNFERKNEHEKSGSLSVPVLLEKCIYDKNSESKRCTNICLTIESIIRGHEETVKQKEKKKKSKKYDKRNIKEQQRRIEKRQQEEKAALLKQYEEKLQALQSQQASQRLEALNNGTDMYTLFSQQYNEEQDCHREKEKKLEELLMLHKQERDIFFIPVSDSTEKGTVEGRQEDYSDINKDRRHSTPSIPVTALNIFIEDSSKSTPGRLEHQDSYSNISNEPKSLSSDLDVYNNRDVVSSIPLSLINPDEEATVEVSASESLTETSIQVGPFPSKTSLLKYFNRVMNEEGFGSIQKYYRDDLYLPGCAVYQTAKKEHKRKHSGIRLPWLKRFNLSSKTKTDLQDESLQESSPPKSLREDGIYPPLLQHKRPSVYYTKEVGAGDDTPHSLKHVKYRKKRVGGILQSPEIPDFCKIEKIFRSLPSSEEEQESELCPSGPQGKIYLFTLGTQGSEPGYCIMRDPFESTSCYYPSGSDAKSESSEQGFYSSNLETENNTFLFNRVSPPEELQYGKKKSTLPLQKRTSCKKNKKWKSSYVVDDKQRAQSKMELQKHQYYITDCLLRLEKLHKHQYEVAKKTGDDLCSLEKKQAKDKERLQATLNEQYLDLLTKHQQLIARNTHPSEESLSEISEGNIEDAESSESDLERKHQAKKKRLNKKLKKLLVENYTIGRNHRQSVEETTTKIDKRHAQERCHWTTKKGPFSQCLMLQTEELWAFYNEKEKEREKIEAEKKENLKKYKQEKAAKQSYLGWLFGWKKAASESEKEKSSSEDFKTSSDSELEIKEVVSLSDKEHSEFDHSDNYEYDKSKPKCYISTKERNKRHKKSLQRDSRLTAGLSLGAPRQIMYQDKKDEKSDDDKKVSQGNESPQVTKESTVDGKKEVSAFEENLKSDEGLSVGDITFELSVLSGATGGDEDPLGKDKGSHEQEKEQKKDQKKWSDKKKKKWLTFKADQKKCPILTKEKYWSICCDNLLELHNRHEKEYKEAEKNASNIELLLEKQSQEQECLRSELEELWKQTREAQASSSSESSGSIVSSDIRSRGGYDIESDVDQETSNKRARDKQISKLQKKQQRERKTLLAMQRTKQEQLDEIQEERRRKAKRLGMSLVELNLMQQEQKEMLHNQQQQQVNRLVERQRQQMNELLASLHQPTMSESTMYTSCYSGIFGYLFGWGSQKVSSGKEENDVEQTPEKITEEKVKAVAGIGTLGSDAELEEGIFSDGADFSSTILQVMSDSELSNDIEQVTEQVEYKGVVSRGSECDEIGEPMDESHVPEKIMRLFERATFVDKDSSSGKEGDFSSEERKSSSYRNRYYGVEKRRKLRKIHLKEKAQLEKQLKEPEEKIRLQLEQRQQERRRKNLMFGYHISEDFLDKLEEDEYKTSFEPFNKLRAELEQKQAQERLSLQAALKKEFEESCQQDSEDISDPEVKQKKKEERDLLVALIEEAAGDIQDVEESEEEYIIEWKKNERARRAALLASARESGKPLCFQFTAQSSSANAASSMHGSHPETQEGQSSDKASATTVEPSNITCPGDTTSTALTKETSSVLLQSSSSSIVTSQDPEEIQHTDENKQDTSLFDGENRKKEQEKDSTPLGTGVSGGYHDASDHYGQGRAGEGGGGNNDPPVPSDSTQPSSSTSSTGVQTCQSSLIENAQDSSLQSSLLGYLLPSSITDKNISTKKSTLKTEGVDQSVSSSRCPEALTASVTSLFSSSYLKVLFSGWGVTNVEAAVTSDPNESKNKNSKDIDILGENSGNTSIEGNQDSLSDSDGSGQSPSGATGGGSGESLGEPDDDKDKKESSGHKKKKKKKHKRKKKEQGTSTETQTQEQQNKESQTSSSHQCEQITSEDSQEEKEPLVKKGGQDGKHDKDNNTVSDSEEGAWKHHTIIVKGDRKPEGNYAPPPWLTHPLSLLTGSPVLEGIPLSLEDELECGFAIDAMKLLDEGLEESASSSDIFLEGVIEGAIGSSKKAQHISNQYSILKQRQSEAVKALGRKHKQQLEELRESQLQKKNKTLRKNIKDYKKKKKELQQKFQEEMENADQETKEKLETICKEEVNKLYLTCKEDSEAQACSLYRKDGDQVEVLILQQKEEYEKLLQQQKEERKQYRGNKRALLQSISSTIGLQQAVVQQHEGTAAVPQDTFDSQSQGTTNSSWMFLRLDFSDNGEGTDNMFPFDPLPREVQGASFTDATSEDQDVDEIAQEADEDLDSNGNSSESGDLFDFSDGDYEDDKDDDLIPSWFPLHDVGISYGDAKGKGEEEVIGQPSSTTDIITGAIGGADVVSVIASSTASCGGGEEEVVVKSKEKEKKKKRKKRKKRTTEEYDAFVEKQRQYIEDCKRKYNAAYECLKAICKEEHNNATSLEEQQELAKQHERKFGALSHMGMAQHLFLQEKLGKKKKRWLKGEDVSSEEECSLWCNFVFEPRGDDSDTISSEDETNVAVEVIVDAGTNTETDTKGQPKEVRTGGENDPLEGESSGTVSSKSKELQEKHECEIQCFWEEYKEQLVTLHDNQEQRLQKWINDGKPEHDLKNTFGEEEAALHQTQGCFLKSLQEKHKREEEEERRQKGQEDSGTSLEQPTSKSKSKVLQEKHASEMQCFWVGYKEKLTILREKQKQHHQEWVESGKPEDELKDTFEKEEEALHQMQKCLLASIQEKHKREEEEERKQKEQKDKDSESSIIQGPLEEQNEETPASRDSITSSQGDTPHRENTSLVTFKELGVESGEEEINKEDKKDSSEEQTSESKSSNGLLQKVISFFQSVGSSFNKEEGAVGGIVTESCYVKSKELQEKHESEIECFWGEYGIQCRLLRDFQDAQRQSKGLRNTAEALENQLDKEREDFRKKKKKEWQNLQEKHKQEEEEERRRQEEGQPSKGGISGAKEKESDELGDETDGEKVFSLTFFGPPTQFDDNNAPPPFPYDPPQDSPQNGEDSSEINPNPEGSSQQESPSESSTEDTSSSSEDEDIVTLLSGNIKQARPIGQSTITTTTTLVTSVEGAEGLFPIEEETEQNLEDVQGSGATQGMVGLSTIEEEVEEAPGASEDLDSNQGATGEVSSPGSKEEVVYLSSSGERAIHKWLESSISMPVTMEEGSLSQGGGKTSTLYSLMVSSGILSFGGDGNGEKASSSNKQSKRSPEECKAFEEKQVQQRHNLLQSIEEKKKELLLTFEKQCPPGLPSYKKDKLVKEQKVTMEDFLCVSCYQYETLEQKQNEQRRRWEEGEDVAEEEDLILLWDTLDNEAEEGTKEEHAEVKVEGVEGEVFDGISEEDKPKKDDKEEQEQKATLGDSSGETIEESQQPQQEEEEKKENSPSGSNESPSPQQEEESVDETSSVVTSSPLLSINEVKQTEDKSAKKKRSEKELDDFNRKQAEQKDCFLGQVQQAKNELEEKYGEACCSASLDELLELEKKFIKQNQKLDSTSEAQFKKLERRQEDKRNRWEEGEDVSSDEEICFIWSSDESYEKSDRLHEKHTQELADFWRNYKKKLSTLKEIQQERRDQSSEDSKEKQAMEEMFLAEQEAMYKSQMNTFAELKQQQKKEEELEELGWTLENMQGAVGGVEPEDEDKIESPLDRKHQQERKSFWEKCRVDSKFIEQEQSERRDRWRKQGKPIASLEEIFIEEQQAVFETKMLFWESLQERQKKEREEKERREEQKRIAELEKQLSPFWKAFKDDQARMRENHDMRRKEWEESGKSLVVLEQLLAEEEIFFQDKMQMLEELERKKYFEEKQSSRQKERQGRFSTKDDSDEDEDDIRYHTVFVQGEGEPPGNEAPPPLPFPPPVLGDSGEMQSGDTGGAGPPSEELSLGNILSSSDEDDNIIVSSTESSSSSSSSSDESDVSSFETSSDEGPDCVDGVYGAVGGEEPEKKKGNGYHKKKFKKVKKKLHNVALNQKLKKLKDKLQQLEKEYHKSIADCQNRYQDVKCNLLMAQAEELIGKSREEQDTLCKKNSEKIKKIEDGYRRQYEQLTESYYTKKQVVLNKLSAVMEKKALLKQKIQEYDSVDGKHRVSKGYKKKASKLKKESKKLEKELEALKEQQTKELQDFDQKSDACRQQILFFQKEEVNSIKDAGGDLCALQNKHTEEDCKIEELFTSQKELLIKEHESQRNEKEKRKKELEKQQQATREKDTPTCYEHGIDNIVKLLEEEIESLEKELEELGEKQEEEWKAFELQTEACRKQVLFLQKAKPKDSAREGGEEDRRAFESMVASQQELLLKEQERQRTEKLIRLTEAKEKRKQHKKKQQQKQEEKEREKQKKKQEQVKREKERELERQKQQLKKEHVQDRKCFVTTFNFCKEQLQRLHQENLKVVHEKGSDDTSLMQEYEKEKECFLTAQKSQYEKLLHQQRQEMKTLIQGSHGADVSSSQKEHEKSHAKTLEKLLQRQESCLKQLEDAQKQERQEAEKLGKDLSKLDEKHRKEKEDFFDHHKGILEQCLLQNLSETVCLLGRDESSSDEGSFDLEGFYSPDRCMGRVGEPIFTFVGSDFVRSQEASGIYPLEQQVEAFDEVDTGRKKEEDSYTDKEKKKKKKSKKERKLESELEKL